MFLNLRNKETGEREIVNTDVVTDYHERYVGPEGEELEAPKAPEVKAPEKKDEAPKAPAK